MRKTILIALAATAFIIVAAGILVTSRIRTVSADLAQRLETQTGIRLATSGLPGVSFWPRFSVSFGNVVIPAPSGASSATLANIATLRVVPADGLLGFGENGIAEIVLEEPSIDLAVGADGRANWNYGARPGEGEPDGIPLRIVNGRIAYLDERSGAAQVFANVEATASLAGPADELNARGAFVWNERRATFTLFLKSPQRVAEDGSPTDLTLQAPGFNFQFSGRTALAKGFELDGQSEIKGTDLGLAASWFGAGLPEGMNGARFELAGAVDSSAQGLLFANAQFTLDDMRGQGDVGMIRGKNRPRLEAHVNVGTIDLSRYGASPGPANAAFLSAPWSQAPLDLSALRTLDAALDVTTNAFAYGAFRTGPTQMKVALNDGVLDLKLARASYVEGTLDLALNVDGKSETPALQFSVNGEGLAADKALSASLGFADLQGKLSPSLALTARGRSLAEMISTLKGQASFRVVSGNLTGVDLPAGFAKVATEILKGWNRDDRANTAFDALSATFSIADGIAATSNLILTGPALTFNGKGEIDLLRQALDLKVDPQLPVTTGADTTAQFAKFPVAIHVKGPWTAPQIYPDMPGILEDPAAAYAALRKLGLGSTD
ncbi:AsmA family protein [Taklimakanibacter lacteus]|uniref:AsmA family protein n=1 Tax=Taklimakanibacter lacteus TaxID=2268456 RepID=UPI000E66B14D